MLFVGSGYVGLGNGTPGNVLLVLGRRVKILFFEAPRRTRSFDPFTRLPDALRQNAERPQFRF